MVNHCPPMIGPFDSYFWVSGTIDVPSGSHGKSRSCSARSSDRLKIQELHVPLDRRAEALTGSQRLDRAAR